MTEETLSEEPEIRSERSLASFLERLLKIGFGLGGVISLAAGAWMWFAPAHWYRVFPGNIPDFGPRNLHFIKDVGGWNAAGGLLLLFALTNVHRFGGVALVVNLVSAFAHSASHIGEVVSGRVGAEHWITDLPFVHAPLILLGIMLWIWWTLQAERHPARPEPKETEVSSQG
jgi:hypothetical protein